jgi:hypothetical protein
VIKNAPFYQEAGSTSDEGTMSRLAISSFC